MSGNNGLNGHPHTVVPAVFEIDLRRALSENAPVSPPALPEERVDDRRVFDPGRNLWPAEWQQFEVVLSALDNLPRIEAIGAMTFDERRTVEERLLDHLDQFCATIAKRSRNE